jgi:TRAP-type transport system small permease protein
MKPWIDRFFKLQEHLVVLLLLAMVVMVFGNVVMRYVFNSGILISEEMSRYCFIWLTYIGAMVAMREGGHLGVDTLVKHLPLAGKKACVLISESLMLFCNVLFVWGTFQMHGLQVTNMSPVVGMSMIWVYGIGYVVGGVMGAFNVRKLWLLLTGQLKEDEMVQVVEDESLKDIEAQLAAERAAGVGGSDATKNVATNPTNTATTGQK